MITELLQKVPWDRLPSAAVVSNRFAEALERGPAWIESQSDTTASVEIASESGGINILVVDDDPLFARVAARCAQVALSDERVVVSRAGTGARAIEKAAHRRPDLVVLDYLLPDMNGVEVLSRLRSMREGFHPEVVVASGTLAVDEQWRFGILGVQDFVSKPIEFSSLVERLHDVARRRAWTHTEDMPAAAQT